MSSRHIILLLAGTIAIIFENINAVNYTKICMEQLSCAYFNVEETSTTAFKHAFTSLSVPKGRPYENARGILYEYLDHLYSAALAVYGYVFIEEPIKWCTLNIHEFRKVVVKDPTSYCTKLMGPAGLTGTSLDALHVSFYSITTYRSLSKVAVKYFKHILDTIEPYIEYTNAKKPKDFCNGYEPNISRFPVQIIFMDLNQQYHQPPDYQNENLVFNQIQQSQPLSTQSNEHFVFDPSQQVHRPPALQNENVFDSSLHQIQQQSQKNKHPTVDLNLHLSVSTPPVYPDEYSSFHDNQVGTSTSYIDNDKYQDFDLNKSPPKD